MKSLRDLLALEIAEQLAGVVLQAVKAAACSVPSGKGYYLNEATSNFVKSLDVVPNPTDEALVQVLIPSYIKYIESGRAPHVTKVPVRALVEWVNEKHLPTDNSFIFAVRQAIWRDGIAPRPMFEAIDDATHQAINGFKPKMAKALVQHIGKSIVSWFKS